MSELFNAYLGEILCVYLILLIGLIFLIWGLSKEIDRRDELIHDYRKKITEYERRNLSQQYKIIDE